jgi:hypothetical protein
MVITPIALYETLVDDLSDRFGSSIAEPIAPEDRGVRYAAKVLQSTLLKKCQDHKEPTADQRALDLFIASNTRCGQWSLKIENMHDEYLIGEFGNEIHRVLDTCYIDDLTYLAKLGNVGPGASIGATGCDFYSKLFSSALTFTSASLLRSYRNSILNQTTWANAEDQRTAQFGHGEVVLGSKLSFVPKRKDVSRVICVEPSVNMFLQKGVEECFKDVLRHTYGIDLSMQPDINRELAKRASVTCKQATIDLSAASDSISLGMCKRFLPKHVVRVLELLRSPMVQLPDGSWLELKMISSMGNGFTFPLETLIFSAVVSAVYRLNGRRLRRTRVLSRGGTVLGNFGVFGDDIICDADLAQQIVRLLNILGFEANVDKTHCEVDHFRESCGGDYIDGYPCRGVYVKSLKTQGSRYVAFNRLMAWSALHGVALPETLELLGRSVQKNLVPLFENDDAGLKCPLWYTPKKRWDAEKFAFRYKPFSQRSPRITFEDTKVVVPKRAKKRTFNPNGMLMAALGGYVGGGKAERVTGKQRADKPQYITIRSNHVHYHRGSAYTSCWDLLPDNVQYGLEQLNAVAEANLVWLTRKA